MSFPRRMGAALAAGLSATALALALGVPAQAAGPGWHVVFTHHYGSPGASSFYLTVVAASRDAAWAFGARNPSGETLVPVAARWNGTTWRNSPLPSGLTSEIVAASTDSASDAWAVTNLGGDILHWNGTAWAVAKRLTGEGQLTGVTALSPTDIWVFGGGGAIGGLGTWHYDGSTWTEQTGGALGIDHASALSPADIWAIGGKTSPQTTIVHYNGTTWTDVTASGLAGLSFSDIVALPQDSVWLLTHSPTARLGGSLVHFAGGKVTRFRIPWAIDPGRLAPDGRGGFWLSASSNRRSYAVHWSASGKWSRVPVNAAGLALIPGTTSLWAAGAVGTTATGENAAVFANGTP
jgi:hypothetical protein